MALFVEGDNVSTAWVEALDRLLAGDGEAVNLTVAIADPTTEVPAIRSVVDAFIDGRRRARPKSVERVSTVANTIFPQSLYIERLGEGAEEHLYELERRSRGVSHVRNRQGTYFERMVGVAAREAEKGPTGQDLQPVGPGRCPPAVGSASRDDQRGNQFEIGLTTPADEAIAVPIVVPGRDRQTMGFPCLSHVSLSLQKGVVHMTAIYRNHEFIKRGMATTSALDGCCDFVAQQSGWPSGELTCVSASASARNWRGVLARPAHRAAAGMPPGTEGGAVRDSVDFLGHALDDLRLPDGDAAIHAGVDMVELDRVRPDSGDGWRGIPRHGLYGPGA